MTGFINRVGICLALLLALLPVTNAAAATRPGLDRWYAAADEFDRLAAASAQSGTLPRRADPAAAAVLRMLSDSRATFGDGRFVFDDVHALLGILSRGQGIVNLYLERGVDQSRGQAAVATRAQGNMTLYQDEVVPVFSLMADGAGHVLPLLVDFGATMNKAEMTDRQKQGIKDVREGLAMTVGGLLGLTDIPGITAQNRLTAATTLGRNAQAYAAGLTLSQRSSLKSNAEWVRRRAGPAVRAELDKLVSALAGTRCEGLCAL